MRLPVESRMTETADAIEIVVADDHPVVRGGLRAVLEGQEDMEVVGEAADVQEALRKVNAFKPDVLLLDLIMPGGPTVDSIPELRTKSDRHADSRLDHAVRSCLSRARRSASGPAD